VADPDWAYTYMPVASIEQRLLQGYVRVNNDIARNSLFDTRSHWRT